MGALSTCVVSLPGRFLLEQIVKLASIVHPADFVGDILIYMPKEAIITCGPDIDPRRIRTLTGFRREGPLAESI